MGNDLPSGQGYSMPSRTYSLRCEGCAAEYDDDGLMMRCTAIHAPALLTTQYADCRFDPDPHGDGIFKYKQWLPVIGRVRGSASAVTYQSEKLSRLTELPNLWISFNGYWPERKAFLPTCTFKDLESYPVLARLPRGRKDILVVASAGNTAAAFARACSLNEIRCLIVIPESALPTMRFISPVNACVKIVSLVGLVDYYDAITLAARASELERFAPEGGVFNVARRDGMGTVLLSAVEAAGRLPEYYFQAIGSGSGAIAVFHTAKRLIADGRFGRNLPRLILSQNLPFAPVYDAWKADKREIAAINPLEGKNLIRQLEAKVLSNRAPAYSVTGGIFDALTESHGDMMAADNAETVRARKLFESTEGIDIGPEGAVAFATLLKAAGDQFIDRNSVILLNVTGGGSRRLKSDHRLISLMPDLEVSESDILAESTLDRIKGLFA
jgi:cysteate synthase